MGAGAGHERAGEDEPEAGEGEREPADPQFLRKDDERRAALAPDLLEQHAFGTGNAALCVLGELRRALVVPAGRDQRRDADLAEAVANIPVSELPGRVPLAETPQRAVHLSAALGAAAEDVVRRVVQAEDMAAPENLLGLLVLGVVRRARPPLLGPRPAGGSPRSRAGRRARAADPPRQVARAA